MTRRVCGSYHDGQDCILWDKTLNYNGAAVVYIGGIGRFAARVIYEEEHGELLPELEVGRYCGVAACVNPEHLFALPRAMRLKLIAAQGRLKRPDKLKSHCKRGHRLKPPNLVYRNKDEKVGRQCKKCKLFYGRNYQRRLRGFYYGGKAFKDECRNGHKRTPENTIYHKEGRRCKECYKATRIRNRKAANARKREVRQLKKI